jgi:hypothetical protein
VAKRDLAWKVPIAGAIIAAIATMGAAFIGKGGSSTGTQAPDARAAAPAPTVVVSNNFSPSLQLKSEPPVPKTAPIRKTPMRKPRPRTVWKRVNTSDSEFWSPPIERLADTNTLTSATDGQPPHSGTWRPPHIPITPTEAARVAERVRQEARSCITDRNNEEMNFQDISLLAHIDAAGMPEVEGDIQNQARYVGCFAGAAQRVPFLLGSGGHRVQYIFTVRQNRLSVLIGDRD